eukprot:12886283-Prorocentrum_lima.AAC.1
MSHSPAPVPSSAVDGSALCGMLPVLWLLTKCAVLVDSGGVSGVTGGTRAVGAGLRPEDADRLVTARGRGPTS